MLLRRAEEACAVDVVAQQAAIGLAADHVDRAQRGGADAEAVEARGDALLVGHGDHASTQVAPAAQAVEEGVERGFLHVDGKHRQVAAIVGEPGVEVFRRFHLGDGRTDDGDQFG
ncbi:hypothetical protein D9M71_689690 [compost metagenome]